MIRLLLLACLIMALYPPSAVVLLPVGLGLLVLHLGRPAWAEWYTYLRDALPWDDYAVDCTRNLYLGQRAWGDADHVYGIYNLSPKLWSAKTRADKKFQRGLTEAAAEHGFFVIWEGGYPLLGKDLGSMFHTQGEYDA